MKRILHVDLRYIRQISPVCVPTYLTALRKYCLQTLGARVQANETKNYMQIDGFVAIYNPVPVLNKVALMLEEQLKRGEIR